MSSPRIRRKYRHRPFPRNTLEETLKVCQTIQDQNNGRPMKRLFIADHLKIKPGSTKFHFLLSSSIKYGLTKGSKLAEYISLTELGEDVAKAESTDTKLPYLREACQKISVFKKFCERYRDAKLPTEEYAKQLLKDEFGIPEEHVSECLNLILTNGRLIGIIREVAGSPYIVLEGVTPIVEEKEEVAEEVPPTLPAPEAIKEKQIFIAHGKNKIPLEQLKRILDQFKVPYMVATDEPHRGRPISQKVGDIMRSCTSAIFIFTGDEETRTSEGEVVYRPSDNVVYELGAASVLYGKNIVIFKEQDVQFASDFSDLGYIDFEKDNLEPKATELLRELIDFGLLKLTPA